MARRVEGSFPSRGLKEGRRDTSTVKKTTAMSPSPLACPDGACVQDSSNRPDPRAAAPAPRRGAPAGSTSRTRRGRRRPQGAQQAPLGLPARRREMRPKVGADDLVKGFSLDVAA